MLSVPQSWRRACGAFLFGIAPALMAAEPADAALTKAWNALIDNRPQEVMRDLGDRATGRQTQLARGAAWMSLQPETDGNMRQAEKIFAALATGDDNVAAEATYLQARLLQIHYQQPDYAGAARIFTALARRQPQSHWAQLGLVKLALLKLYVLPESTEPVADRLAPAEALLSQISEPALQRDLQLQIGQAGVVLKQPPRRFIPHLVAADRIGGITGTAREDLVVQIGELSLRAGLLEQSKEYFERYLKEYPDNLRAYAVARRLEETKRRLAAGKEAAK
ncbi:MAG: tol-pal system YbgF family protein [Opitutales bacterium]